MTSGKCGKNLTWLFKDGTLIISGQGEMYNYFRGKAPWFGRRDTVKKIIIAEGVETIGEYAFCQLKALEGVEIPASVTEIKAGAFAGCEGLKGIKLSDKLVGIGDEAFFNCVSLTDVTIGDGVEKIGAAAFAACTSLKTAKLPRNVRLVVGEKVFDCCSSLEKIHYPASFAFKDRLSQGNNAEIKAY